MLRVKLTTKYPTLISLASFFTIIHYFNATLWRYFAGEFFLPQIREIAKLTTIVTLNN
jgi:hypothetical protein